MRRFCVGLGARLRRDDGAAVAEFAMISVLLVFLLFAVLQVALLFYVRTVVASSAADGARWAANADVAPADGAARAQSLIAQGVGSAVSDSVRCTSTSEVDAASGLPTVAVRCTGAIRSVFLPIGVFTPPVDVTAHALKEQQP